jgi:ABC-2 type transport system ATP-binding protein
MQYAIEVAELTKKFGDFLAVDGISLKIKKGEIFGFLGPNGAGKTTTIRILCGVIKPTSGKGSIMGFSLDKIGNIKQKIGYMSQKFSLYNELTVKENLNFYAQVYGITGEEWEERKQKLILLGDLHGKENMLIKNLSGGWRQKIAIVCAIVHDPQILFLDEPTSGVDPISRRKFWEILYNLAHLGTTIIVSTHFMDEAEHCHRLALLSNGKLIGCDTPKRLKETANKENLEEVFMKLIQENR